MEDTRIPYLTKKIKIQIQEKFSIKKFSEKVIPKRIYVILNNVMLLDVFFKNSYQKHCNKLKDIKVIPEKEFSVFMLRIFFYSLLLEYS